MNNCLIVENDTVLSLSLCVCVCVCVCLRACVRACVCVWTNVNVNIMPGKLCYSEIFIGLFMFDVLPSEQSHKEST